MYGKIVDWLKTCPTIHYYYFLIRGVVRQFVMMLMPVNLSCNEGNFVFIVGSGRSGNTLLRRLLMEKANIYIPPETYVLGAEVVSLLNNKALSWNEKVDLLLGKLEYHPEFITFEVASFSKFAIAAKKWPKEKQVAGKLFVELYKWLASEKCVSSAWIGDKTPLNTLNLGLISRLLPEAKFIYIERDGADVVHSYVKAGIYRDYHSAAHRWLKSKRAWGFFRKSLKNSSFIEVSYEVLVSNPDDVIDDIITQFGMPRREIKLELSDLLGDVKMHKHHNSVSKNTSRSSIGKGRASLSTNDKKTIARILNKELVLSGYNEL